MTTYRSVKVPDDLVETIKKFIKENNDLGYRSHAEFIIDATRRRLEELKKSRA